MAVRNVTAELTLKAHDSLPVAEADLSFSDGSWPDLTQAGTRVTFIMSRLAEPPKVYAAAVIVQAAASDPATVRYLWKKDGSDTNVVDAGWRAEWEVVWPDGNRQTFPQTSYHSVAILPDADYYAQ